MCARVCARCPPPLTPSKLSVQHHSPAAAAHPLLQATGLTLAARAGPASAALRVQALLHIQVLTASWRQPNSAPCCRQLERAAWRGGPAQADGQPLGAGECCLRSAAEVGVLRRAAAGLTPRLQALSPGIELGSFKQLRSFAVGPCEAAAGSWPLWTEHQVRLQEKLTHASKLLAPNPIDPAQGPLGAWIALTMALTSALQGDKPGDEHNKPMLLLWGQVRLLPCCPVAKKRGKVDPT